MTLPYPIDPPPETVPEVGRRIRALFPVGAEISGDAFGMPFCGVIHGHGETHLQIERGPRSYLTLRWDAIDAGLRAGVLTVGQRR